VGYGQTLVSAGMAGVMVVGIGFYTVDVAAGKSQAAPETFVASIVGSGGVAERQNTISEEFVSVRLAEPPRSVADLPPFRIG
jgi:hypothetical protein